MSLQFAKACTADAVSLMCISKKAFYQKLGYVEVRRDGDFVYYEKLRGEPIIL